MKEGFPGCWLVWYLGQIALYQISRIAERKRACSGAMYMEGNGPIGRTFVGSPDSPRACNLAGSGL